MVTSQIIAFNLTVPDEQMYTCTGSNVRNSMVLTDNASVVLTILGN